MTFQSLKENNDPQLWIQEMKIFDYLMICATIHIGRKILCLPYAGFFGTNLKKKYPEKLTFNNCEEGTCLMYFGILLHLTDHLLKGLRRRISSGSGYLTAFYQD